MAFTITTPRPLLHVPLAYMIALIIFLPTFSLLTIVSLGVYLHFEETTTTHCQVPNMIPSISSVVGGVTPERYIWRLGIAIYSFPRLVNSVLYFNFFSEGISGPGWVLWGNRLLFLLSSIQNFGLYGLTYISSKENYIIHRNCFITFITCSILDMILFLILFKAIRTPFTYRDKISYRLRLSFAISHVLLFLLSLYFFWRHNKYCEPYMYSCYGLCEYLVVLTNIAFHGILAVDFQNDYYISVAPPSRLKLN